MPTVITGYAVKAVMGVGIRWEYEPLHLPVLSDECRLAPTLPPYFLDLPQNLKIHIDIAFVFAA